MLKHHSNQLYFVTTSIRLFVVTGLMLLSVTQAKAHDHDGDHGELALKAYQKMAQMALDFEVELTDPQLQTETAPSYFVGGKRVYFNSYHWQIVVEGLRAINHEHKEECDSCTLIDEAFMTALPQRVEAKGFVARKIAGPLGRRGEAMARMGGEMVAIDGPAQAAAKVSLEVAEDFAMMFFAGLPLHIFCNAIDFVVLLAPRYTLTTVRTWNYSREMQVSRTRSIARTVKAALTFRTMGKPRRRMAWDLPAFELDAEEVAELDAVGPKRFLGLASRGKRAVWLEKIESRLSRLQPGTDEYEKLSRKLTAVTQWQYQSHRYKRFFFLKGRKLGHSGHLRGPGAADQIVGKTVFWPLAVQEGLINAASKPPAHEQSRLLDRVQHPPVSNDEIIEGLAEEQSSGDTEKMAQIRSQLADIEYIFNPANTPELRRLVADDIEGFVAGILYKLSGSEFEELEIRPDHAGFWRRLKSTYQLAHHRAKPMKWAYKFFDYLHIAAQEKNPARLALRQYQAMEAYLKLMETLKLLRPNAEQFDFEAWKASARQNYKELNTYHPWKEKRSRYSWLPLPWRESMLGLPLGPSKHPTCNAIVEVER